ncbi:MAG: PLP-dependent transferase [Gammaproteobacteria bacterium]|nr:PLP-dependent transferase [Gammaproteobacteria bacterium]MYF59474.1 PLP-dependent transferase [Gammaproteobacteria bacterium]MYH32235.1 PLP-dependent transferase [Gammaproteobacteria bacterium]MYH34293.1 PLP-dependent transferase [Gammaproteobacteria bacterium]MYL00443.1 PLP-dependent transferase [Gammaproteobacteria bacterium]
MRFSTKQIHAGTEPDPVTGSVLPPIYQSTTFAQPSVDEYLSKGYSYSRSGNPTVRALEQRLAGLENGEDCTCYSTGMAAVSAVLHAFLNAGDHALVSQVAYGGTYRVCTQVFARFGARFTFVDTSDLAAVEAAIRPETRLLLTETPANPTLALSDIAALSEIARANKLIHVVDNTFLTPYYQQPLALGADVSLHSTTKYLDGHNATVGGANVAATAELDEKLRFVQNATGSIMSPMVAWLTLQGVKTLSVRMDRQSASALAIAQFLSGHPAVGEVCYPGLESFAQHELAGRQASGFGAMLWCELKGGLEAGKALMDSVELWTLAENLGAVESLITHPVTMTHADVEPEERQRVGLRDGLVRFSVGLEAPEDLIEALDAALSRL